jgi:leucyl/phenylalanyl-tRNA--protein transferase
MDADGEILASGGELSAAWLLAGYRAGVFPMPHWEDDGTEELYWYSPYRRGVFPLDSFKISRSLRSAIAKHEIRIDAAFEDVLMACARPHDEEHRWLTAEFADAYRELHRLGWSHSIESWTSDGELVGGVLCVEVGGLLAGDTMVSFRTNGSKIALAGAIELLNRDPMDRVFDTQWVTPHLESLGAVEISRRRYHDVLVRALARPGLLA